MEESPPRTPEFSKSLSRELEEVINKQNLLTSRTRRRVLVSLQEQTNKDEDLEMEGFTPQDWDRMVRRLASDQEYYDKVACTTSV